VTRIYWRNVLVWGVAPLALWLGIGCAVWWLG
jgi:hypothetical protein